jgi:hypothetical protein
MSRGNEALSINDWLVTTFMLCQVFTFCQHTTWLVEATETKQAKEKGALHRMLPMSTVGLGPNDGVLKESNCWLF